MYIILHFVFGLLGVALYKYGAEGPANPQGEFKIERDMFWLILWTGIAGFTIALIAAGDNLFSKVRLASKKQTEKEPAANEEDFLDDIPELTEETAQELRKFM